MTDERDLTATAASLIRALANEPMPERVVEAAKAAYTWRTIDAELATLSFDSAMAGTVGTRSGRATRELTFEADSGEVEVAVGTDGAVVGQIVPPQRATVEVIGTDGSVTIDTDDEGRFLIDELPQGPVCFEIVTAAGHRIRTDWIVL